MASDSIRTVSFESFSYATLLHKESCGNKAIQVALGAIIALGLTVFIFSYFYPFSAVVWKVGIGSSAISLIAWKVFNSYSSSELDREIDACETFAEINELLESVSANVSFTATYVVRKHEETHWLFSTTSTVDYIALKVEKMIASHLQDDPEATYPQEHPHLKCSGKTFFYTDGEETQKDAAVLEISHLFEKLKDNIKTRNLLIRMCYNVPAFFRFLICYHDIEERYSAGGDNSAREMWDTPKSTDPPGNHKMPNVFGYRESAY